MVLRSRVNHAFRTSMEVGTRVSVEDLMTVEVRHTSSAYLMFVAPDAATKPWPIGRQHRLALRASGCAEPNSDPPSTLRRYRSAVAIQAMSLTFNNFDFFGRRMTAVG